MSNTSFRLQLFLAATLWAAPAFSAEKGSDILRKAQEDLKAGRYSALDQRYLDSLKQGTQGRVLSYVTMMSLGVPANLKELEKWTQKKPKSPSAWASLGLAYLEEAKKIRKTAPRSKEFKEAYAKSEAYVDKAYALAPKDINMSSFQIECRKVGGWGRK